MIRARHRWHWLCRCTGLAPARTRRQEPARRRVPRPGPRPALAHLAGCSRSLLGIEAAERLGEDPLPARPALAAHRLRLAMPGEDRAPHRPQRSREASTAYRRLLAVRPRRRHPGRTRPASSSAHCAPTRSPNRSGPDRCPPGTFEPHAPTVLYVGRDDFGTDRYLPLRGLTGICVSGLPGYGKTSLIASWLCQLTTTPAAQFALLDGKDGGDQEPWHDRAWRHAGDQLADALDVLEDVHAEMRRRLRIDHRPLRPAQRLERRRTHRGSAAAGHRHG